MSKKKHFVPLERIFPFAFFPRLLQLLSTYNECNCAMKLFINPIRVRSREFSLFLGAEGWAHKGIQKANLLVVIFCIFKSNQLFGSCCCSCHHPFGLTLIINGNSRQNNEIRLKICQSSFYIHFTNKTNTKMYYRMGETMRYTSNYSYIIFT